MRPATCFIALICAAEPTRVTEKTDGNGGAHALIEQIGFQINLAVRDRNHVRRNVGRNVARLRLDDRQRGERTVAVFFARRARGTFEQTAVQIEKRRRDTLRGPDGRFKTSDTWR